jgi:hypothetical protein
VYSLVSNCKRDHVDPFADIKDFLERLPTHHAEQLADLLPDAWFVAHPHARRKVAS